MQCLFLHLKKYFTLGNLFICIHDEGWGICYLLYMKEGVAVTRYMWRRGYLLPAIYRGEDVYSPLYVEEGVSVYGGRRIYYPLFM